MIESFLQCAVLITSQVLALPTPETVIRFTVDPMPAPKPALRYLLLPELREMTQGNPIPNYLKCLLDQDFSADQETLGHSALRQADRAARMDKPDWQILPKIRTDGIGLLLPDLQKMRQIAADLSGRFRDELAQRRFDDAIVTAKTMFAMSRHMGEHPTLIGDLVGIAIAMVAIAPLEEMLQQPGCPNLYWALTNLPHPFLSLEKGMEGERMFLAAELRDLDHQNPMTPEQLKKLMAYVDKLRELTKEEETARAWVAKRAKDEKYLASARERLVEHGLNKQRLASFPAEQVILLDEERAYEVLRDEGMKYMSLPTWEALAGIDTIQMPKERGLFIDFLSAVNRVRRAQGRLEQRIALLRHVEALRLYAAAHEGKLPAKLADVGVPLPLDPFTGKPFRYEVKDDVAHVRGSPPKGDEKSAVYNIHYEITIRK